MNETHREPVALSQTLFQTAMAIASRNLRARNVSGIYSIDVVVGGQYGSEAKGHATAQIIKSKLDTANEFPVLNIRVAGPNAGHTVYAPVDVSFLQYSGGETTVKMLPFAFRQLPVGIVENADLVYCGIAAGSEVELSVLLAEVALVKSHGLWPEHRVMIVDPEATLVFDRDHTRESDLDMVDRIGSTGKGVGSARSSRIMRTPGRRIKDNPDAIRALHDAGVIVQSLDRLYSIDPELLADEDVQYQIVIEGTQGYGLGLHAGSYPQTTSSDCRAIDFLAMAGVSPWACDDHGGITTWVVVRPFPIRVAGNSGPLKGETTWEALSLPEERTTVTKKVRRVGTWDTGLAQAAVRANGGGFPHTRNNVVLVLTMADQYAPGVAGATMPSALYHNRGLQYFIEQIQTETGAMVDLVTTGPHTAVWL